MDLLHKKLKSDSPKSINVILAFDIILFVKKIKRLKGR